MTTIITKNGSGAPSAGQLSQGELAVDLTNKELYSKDSGNNVVKIGSVTSGGSTGTFTDLTATNSLAVTGNTTATGDLDITGDLDVTGNVDVTGITTAIGNVNVTGITTATGNVDVTGDLDVTGELLAQAYNETFASVTSSSNATTVNCEAGNVFSHTLTESTTFTFSNPPASGTAFGFTLKIIQDASASGFAVTWPASVGWADATAPTLTSTANAVDVFVFFTHDGGTTWYGFTAGQGLA